MVLRKFLRSNSGNVTLFFAIGLLPIIGMVGASIDYSRGSNAKSKLLAAVDSAAISANRIPSLTLAAKTDIARKVIAAHLSEAPYITFTPEQILVSENNGLLDVAATANIDTTFMGLLGVSTLTISAAGQSINRIENGAEIALVLDTTGSMSADMGTLKTSVTQFMNTILPTSGGQVKMGIVPYVASVNPGVAAMNGLTDTAAESEHHGQLFEQGAYVSIAPCDFPPPSGGGGGGGGGGPPPFDPGAGGTESGASLKDWMLNLATGTGDIFRIGSAYAAGPITPNTSGPLATTNVTVNPPEVVNPITFQLPDGFRNGLYGSSPCHIWNPEKVSQFDLFDRIPGATWKGCVEARREPYDVTDDAASNTNPDTLFVPYFWPDEPVGAKNDFLPLLPVPDPLAAIGLAPVDMIDNQDATQSILKYNGTANGGAVQIDEEGTDTMGPNKACPDPIVPLTTSLPTLQNAVAGLTHKADGGTINSEGVMWGWRLLSPGAPFTEGAAYGAVKKYMVLMSDGKSEMLSNPVAGNWIYSDYTAYGYLAQWETRLSMGREGIFEGDRVRTFTEARSYLDDRFALACENAKAAGITIFTILFREADPTAKSLMQACASKPAYAQVATDPAALKDAFGAVASLLQNLRLTK